MNTLNRLSAKPLTLAMFAAALVGVISLGLLVAKPSTAQTSAAAATSAKPALTVSLVQAKTGSLAVKLSANGSVAAWQEASVGTETGGLRVAELHVNVGDSVKKGQVLASFATESVQADVALTRAALAEAQANAAEAAANAERARAVQGSGALSAQQINQYLTHAWHPPRHSSIRNCCASNKPRHWRQTPASSPAARPAWGRSWVPAARCSNSSAKVALNGAVKSLQQNWSASKWEPA